MELWVKIKALNAQGVGVKTIARQLAINKKTVKKYLQQEQPPNYQARPSKLDPFRDEIGKRVDQGLTATRILREIRPLGYQGGYSILKTYIRSLRPPRPELATVRFETEPGAQAQVDWSAFGDLVIDGQTKSVSCFAMILGWSRAQYIEFTARQNLETFLQCHINAFRYFGGVPHQILYDNLKSVVLSRCGRSLEFNRRFLELAGYYGFEPRACWPYRPQTKGKVERNFQYVEKDFFLGQELPSLDAYNQQARVWLDTIANCRVHGTTRERPWDRLAVERGQLIGLEGRPDFDCAVMEIRKVSRDCLISFEANRYSVPYCLAGQTVFVYARNDQLEIRCHGQLMACHRRVEGKGRMIVDQHHYQGLRVPKPERTLSQIHDEFIQLGPHAPAYLQGLIRTHHGNARYQAEKILRLHGTYRAEPIDQAMAHALCYGAFGWRVIENIIRQQSRRPGPVDPWPVATTALGRCPLVEIAVEQRSLQVYAQVAEGRTSYGD